MRILIVTAVEKEAEAINRSLAASMNDANVSVGGCVGGVGRVNGAAATTEALVRAAIDQQRYQLVLNAGVAGALPEDHNQYPLSLGEVIVATECVYVEEGLITPDGFEDMAGLDFPLGDFPGNRVPTDSNLLKLVGDKYTTGSIATVATCSGTDDAARMVAQRTSAIAEAMEGAAVVHAARRLGIAGGEIRAISNTTGDRDQQQWDLAGALQALGQATSEIIHLVQSSGM